MKNVIIAVLAAAALNVSAAELYLDSGEVIEIPEGVKVYVSDVPVFEFTKFDGEGFDLRPVEPIAETDECEDDFTFGGEGCQ